MAPQTASDARYSEATQRLASHEAMCEERSKTIFNRLEKIEVLEQARKFNHDNLMILERDRQKAWEENKLLKERLKEYES